MALKGKWWLVVGSEPSSMCEAFWALTPTDGLYKYNGHNLFNVRHLVKLHYLDNYFVKIILSSILTMT